jgi:hypothetical protein
MDVLSKQASRELIEKLLQSTIEFYYQCNLYEMIDIDRFRYELISIINKFLKFERITLIIYHDSMGDLLTHEFLVNDESTVIKINYNTRVIETQTI